MNKDMIADFFSQNPEAVLIGTGRFGLVPWSVTSGITVLVTGIKGDALTVAYSHNMVEFQYAELNKTGAVFLDKTLAIHEVNIKAEMNPEANRLFNAYRKFMDSVQSSGQFQSHGDVIEHFHQEEPTRLLGSAQIFLPEGAVVTTVEIIVAVDQLVVVASENINELIPFIGALNRTDLDINEEGNAYVGTNRTGGRITLPLSSIYTESPAPAISAPSGDDQRPYPLQEGDLVTRPTEGRAPQGYGRIVRIMDYVKIGVQNNFNPDYAVPLDSLEVVKYAQVNMTGGDRITVPLDSLIRYNSASLNQR